MSDQEPQDQAQKRWQCLEVPNGTQANPCGSACSDFKSNSRPAGTLRTAAERFYSCRELRKVQANAQGRKLQAVACFRMHHRGIVRTFDAHAMHSAGVSIPCACVSA
jgi:hypothetical protein